MEGGEKHNASVGPAVTTPLYAGLTRRQLGGRPNVIGLPVSFEAAAEDQLVHQKQYTDKKCALPSNTRSTFLMVFSPDGKLVASTHGDHCVYVCDVATGKCIRTLSGHPRTPWCLAFHPTSSQLLASGCLGGQVRVWDLSGGSEIWCAEEQTVIASLAFHPSSERLLVIATYNELLFWDWSKPKPFAKCCTRNEKEKVRFVKFDRLGHKLITGIANRWTPPSQWDQQSTSSFNRPFMSSTASANIEIQLRVSELEMLQDRLSASINSRVNPTNSTNRTEASGSSGNTPSWEWTTPFTNLLQEYESLVQRCRQRLSPQDQNSTNRVDRGTNTQDPSTSASTSSFTPPTPSTSSTTRTRTIGTDINTNIQHLHAYVRCLSRLDEPTTNIERMRNPLSSSDAASSTIPVPTSQTPDLSNITVPCTVNLGERVSDQDLQTLRDMWRAGSSSTATASQSPSQQPFPSTEALMSGSFGVRPNGSSLFTQLPATRSFANATRLNQSTFLQTPSLIFTNINPSPPAPPTQLADNFASEPQYTSSEPMSMNEATANIPTLSQTTSSLPTPNSATSATAFVPWSATSPSPSSSQETASLPTPAFDPWAASAQGIPVGSLPTPACCPWSDSSQSALRSQPTVSRSEQAPSTTQESTSANKEPASTSQKTPPTSQQTPSTSQQTPSTSQQTPSTSQQTPSTSQQTPSTSQEASPSSSQRHANLKIPPPNRPSLRYFPTDRFFVSGSSKSSDTNKSKLSRRRKLPSLSDIRRSHKRLKCAKKRSAGTTTNNDTKDGTSQSTSAGDNPQAGPSSQPDVIILLDESDSSSDSSDAISFQSPLMRSNQLPQVPVINITTGELTERPNEQRCYRILNPIRRNTRVLPTTRALLVSSHRSAFSPQTPRTGNNSSPQGSSETSSNRTEAPSTSAQDSTTQAHNSTKKPARIIFNKFLRQASATSTSDAQASNNAQSSSSGSTVQTSGASGSSKTSTSATKASSSATKTSNSGATCKTPTTNAERSSVGTTTSGNRRTYLSALPRTSSSSGTPGVRNTSSATQTSARTSNAASSSGGGGGSGTASSSGTQTPTPALRRTPTIPRFLRASADLGMRYAIRMLSRHIDLMERRCRARLEILQLEQIRRLWEEFMNQLSSLNSTISNNVREGGDEGPSSRPDDELLWSQQASTSGASQQVGDGDAIGEEVFPTGVSNAHNQFSSVVVSPEGIMVPVFPPAASERSSLSGQVPEDAPNNSNASNNNNNNNSTQRNNSRNESNDTNDEYQSTLLRANQISVLRRFVTLLDRNDDTQNFPSLDDIETEMENALNQANNITQNNSDNAEARPSQRSGRSSPTEFLEELRSIQQSIVERYDHMTVEIPSQEVMQRDLDRIVNLEAAVRERLRLNEDNLERSVLENQESDTSRTSPWTRERGSSRLSHDTASPSSSHQRGEFHGPSHRDYDTVHIGAMGYEQLRAQAAAAEFQQSTNLLQTTRRQAWRVLGLMVRHVRQHIELHQLERFSEGSALQSHLQQLLSLLHRALDLTDTLLTQMLATRREMENQWRGRPTSDPMHPVFFHHVTDPVERWEHALATRLGRSVWNGNDQELFRFGLADTDPMIVNHLIQHHRRRNPNRILTDEDRENVSEQSANVNSEHTRQLRQRLGALFTCRRSDSQTPTSSSQRVPSPSQFRPYSTSDSAFMPSSHNNSPFTTPSVEVTPSTSSCPAPPLVRRGERATSFNRRNLSSPNRRDVSNRNSFSSSHSRRYVPYFPYRPQTFMQHETQAGTPPRVPTPLSLSIVRGDTGGFHLSLHDSREPNSPREFATVADLMSSLSNRRSEGDGTPSQSASQAASSSNQGISSPPLTTDDLSSLHQTIRDTADPRSADHSSESTTNRNSGSYVTRVNNVYTIHRTGRRPLRRFIPSHFADVEESVRSRYFRVCSILDRLVQLDPSPQFRCWAENLRRLLEMPHRYLEIEDRRSRFTSAGLSVINVPSVRINDVPVNDPSTLSSARVPSTPTSPPLWTRRDDEESAGPSRQRSRSPSPVFGRGRGNWRSWMYYPRNRGVPTSARDLFGASHQATMEGVRGAAVSCPTTITHRIQCWPFVNGNIPPDISNPQQHLVVANCRINNDASIDISRDGRLLVALVPSTRPGGYGKLGIYSLETANLGQLLFATPLEQSPVSVSLSPSSRFLLVGLATKRFLTVRGENSPAAQVFRLPWEIYKSALNLRVPLDPTRFIYQTSETGYVSINCIRWAPISGQGMVYGTNTGSLGILR